MKIIIATVYMRDKEKLEWAKKCFFVFHQEIVFSDNPHRVSRIID